MSPGDVHRAGRLLGARVVGPDGRVLGHVNDLRLAPGPAIRGLRAELVVEGLLVADRHAGSLLGYDRRREQGPWPVRTLVRALHRRASFVPWSAVVAVSWSDGEVTIDPAQRRAPDLP
jgi:hypothetical protein